MFDVKFNVPERPLGIADIKFVVKHNGEKLGTLLVSKGALVWFPRDQKRGHRMNWIRFDKEMSKIPPSSGRR